MTISTVKNYYAYNNGAYEIKDSTTVSDNSPIAKTEKISRKITGPIPREELAKLVEHIDLNDNKWQEKMHEVLSKEQFIVEGIHADFPANSVHEMGMTKTAYVKSYFTWKTASVVAASAFTFFVPSMLAKYVPDAASALQLPPFKEEDGFVSYSAQTWAKGIGYAAENLQKHTDKIPSYIKSPVVSYLGYKGLESLVEKAIQYPAIDYKTWTALNLQKYLQEIYSQMIPEQYQNDPVLNEVKSPEGLPIRSPFKIDNAQELGKIYEEHVLKNILNNQQKNTKKLCCPSDGKTEIKIEDVQRDSKLADRIELRLLLLDAHEYKKMR
jgi:hypothetical protein